MRKQKVRPMIDKELRDEIVSYCGGESFNSALRHYTKELHRLHGQVNHRERQSIELMKKNTELSATLDETIKQRNNWSVKWYKERNDLLLSGKWKKVGAAGFVAVGIAIGAAVMTFVFNVT